MTFLFRLLLKPLLDALRSALAALGWFQAGKAKAERDAALRAAEGRRKADEAAARELEATKDMTDEEIKARIESRRWWPK